MTMVTIRDDGFDLGRLLVLVLVSNNSYPQGFQLDVRRRQVML